MASTTSCISNSEGGLGRLRELGARRAEAVFWGADPDLFRPHDVAKEYDVFFYGYGDKFRREWMQALIGEPSRLAPEIDFALGGRDFRGDIGSARLIGDVPVQRLRARDLGGARQPQRHAPLARDACPRSATSRPFELAAAGRGDRLEPVEGIERWFDPGRELLVVENADEAVDAYRDLLADPAQAEELGRRARERVLDEHTYAHRARAACSS